MKLRTLALLLAALLLPSLALTAPASAPQPGPNALLAALSLDAPNCAGTASTALTPQPLFRDDVILCGSSCSATLCAGKFVGQVCGSSTTTHCVSVPSCTPGEVSCACR